MPAIQITQDQQDALDRGDHIVIGPPHDDLHNVVLFVKGTHSRSSLYIWDGCIAPDGKIYATRYQWLTNVWGDPCNEDVREYPGRGSWITERANVHIVQVGA